ncbi:MAG: spore maturation protein [Sulfobacillus benefaciens]|uniref:Spore maturation protein n=1 Tax=Sulfobacillus benefaciens TaxID=453960 RepID=A0A2T2XGE4_9FIRM|nr:MAG: spore maturation protein [Sulfobacillus benefaciens]
MSSVLIDTISIWAIPFLIGFIPLFGWLRGVKVYETFVEGAQEGFNMAIRMIPFLVGILVALNIFQASGAFDAVIHLLAPILGKVGVPAAVVPLILVRPLSGGAALGVTTGLLQHYGPDSFVGRVASTLQGSTDTTFYVITLYFGSIAVRQTRYALPVALIGDLAGFVAAIVICHLLF